MKITDMLFTECNNKYEMWGGDTVEPLQCDKCCGMYRILQWDAVKRDYDEWIVSANPCDVLLRYFRAKCFEGVLLDSDGIDGQVDTFVDMVNKGELHR